MLTLDQINRGIAYYRAKAKSKLPPGWDDNLNTRNDWLAFAMTHLGRASEKHASNEVYDPQKEVLKALGILFEGLQSGKFDAQ